MRMWKVLLISCAVSLSMHSFEAEDEILNVGLLSRRTENARRSKLDNSKEITNLEDVRNRLEFFPKEEKQSMYLHPNKEYFRVQRLSLYPREGQGFDDAKNDVDAKDTSMKAKISLVVEQTMHVADHDLKTIAPLKEKYKSDSIFKIGYITIMLMRARQVLDGLFVVAVKNRDQWHALEQLKILELIIRTNSDASKLVQQLIVLNQEVQATKRPE